MKREADFGLSVGGALKYFLKGNLVFASSSIII